MFTPPGARLAQVDFLGGRRSLSARPSVSLLRTTALMIRQCANLAAVAFASAAIVSTGFANGGSRDSSSKLRLDYEGRFWGSLPRWLCHWARDSTFLRSIVNALPYLVVALTKPHLVLQFLRPKHFIANVSYDDDDDDDEEGRPWRTFDLYRSPTSTSAAEEKPVLIFVHGGVWTFGSRHLYRFLGSRLAEEGYTVCIADYRKWTTRGGDSLSQASDVAAILRWWQQPAPPCEHVTPSAVQRRRVFLAGHSSGAHVCALAFCLDRTLSNACEGFIGLAGVYAVADHHEFEKSRGVHIVSMLDPANGGRSAWDSRSPLHLLRTRASAIAMPRRGVLLIAGLNDSTVPISQSEMFCKALKQHGNCSASLLRLGEEEGGDHSEFLKALMDPDGSSSTESASLLSALRNFTSSSSSKL